MPRKQTLATRAEAPNDFRFTANGRRVLRQCTSYLNIAALTPAPSNISIFAGFVYAGSANSSTGSTASKGELKVLSGILLIIRVTMSAVHGGIETMRQYEMHQIGGRGSLTKAFNRHLNFFTT